MTLCNPILLKTLKKNQNLFKNVLSKRRLQVRLITQMIVFSKSERIVMSVEISLNKILMSLFLVLINPFLELKHLKSMCEKIKKLHLSTLKERLKNMINITSKKKSS
jgi:hypothetical protein